MQKIELPSKYYLDHFLEMLETIKQTHLHLLEKSHLEFLEHFEALSENGKCLFIRMANRRGTLFDKNTFEFTEWEELAARGFARPLCPDDEELFISWVKKDQIKKILDQSGISYKKSAAKPALVEIFREQREKISDLQKEWDSLIIHHSYSVLHYILFVLFGKIQDNLILYTLRDLGIKKSHGKKSLKPKFDSIEEARSVYFYSTLTERPLEWPLPVGEEARLKREKILLKAAEEEKKNGNLEEALQLFSMCETYPATEKRARLLYELERKEECLRALQKMMDHPGHDEELLFAEDFLARKYDKKKLSRLTETLRNARLLQIDESFFRHPEFGVIDHYKNSGIKGHFAENFIWTAIFAMIFHDQITSFERHSEFDYVPYDFQKKIQFDNLDNWNWEEALEKDYSDSDLFVMDDASREMIRDFVTHLPKNSLEHMIRYLVQDFKERRTGFPDIFVIEEGEIKFIEIKAEGDSLKNSQLKQMRELEKAGLKVEVLNVSYKYNPDQVYVVIDIETTGHLSPYNRITEVAAVKVKGAQIVDRFQSLVNPKRPIPGNIQAMTGITNEMVRKAPVFEEIAENLEEFTKGAIFVAHNVHFDYGFIQKEFERMEKRFVRPYICTKMGMKKHYPKLDSYGLKNLTNIFSIPLAQHHRAMSDAEAAAGLLNLINDKRALK